MNRHVILEMGAGQCGSLLLLQILDKQPQTRVTHEQLPWLPWERQPDAPGIRERLRRMLAAATERRVGDVASFYLPYADDAIQYDPGVRIICLSRPREEVVRGFCRFLDQSSGIRVCNERFGRPMIAFFQPLVRTIDDGYWYLAEDYAFSHRARESGLHIFADTSIRLWHIGTGRYGWEDAGTERMRCPSFTLDLEEQSDGKRVEDVACSRNPILDSVCTSTSPLK